MKYSALAVFSALLGAVMCLAAPAHAYTINTTEVGKRIRWASDSVGLQMDSEYQQFLRAGDSYAALAIGFDAWRGLPRVPDLVIRPGLPESVGHHDGHPTNGIYLLREWPYEAAKLAVTIVTYEMDSGRLLDADIVVNGQAKFALLNEPTQPGIDAYDLAAVLTHEAGHVLGLGESASGPEATMWPYAKPDDTDKRTLANDDEEGVTQSYLGAPPAAAGGCVSNSVGGRARSRTGLTLGFWLLAVIPALRMSRRRQRQAAAVAGLALVTCLVGFDTQASEPTPADRRLATLETLLANGTRDNREQLEALATDDDAQISHRAQYALHKVLARAGQARVSAHSAPGAQRVAQLMGSGERVFVGRAKRAATHRSGGLLFTEYQVQAQNGQTAVLRVPGGTQDGISQRVLDAEPLPADDAELAVVPQADGSQHWAYHQAGLLFGGHLGDGAAVEHAL
jgi:hypothetical protein